MKNSLTTPSSLSRRRKSLFAMTAITALTLALGACGSEDVPNDDPNAELTGELVFWNSFTQGPRAEYMQKMADKFVAEHPKVSITIDSFAWPEFYTKWTTGLASGQVPDISSALPTHVVEMLAAEAIVPLDDVIDDIGRDRFSEAALSEGQQDGQNYSIPIYTHAQVMWYRKDLLEANNLEVPETWDDLKAAALKLNNPPDLYGLSVPLGQNDMMATRFLNYYVQSAGETLLTDDGHANLTSPAVIDGINYWVDMYNSTSPKSSINYTVLEQATLYYQGQTAFDFNSGFQISGVESTSPDLVDQIAAAPLPRLNKGDAIYGGETSNTPMVVWKASKNQRAAKEFLKTLYEDDPYIDFIHSVPGGMLPSLNDISENPKYLDDPTLEAHRETVDVIAEAVDLGTAIGMEDGPKLQAGILTSQGVIERMFQDIILTGNDVSAAAEAAETELNALFKSAGADLD